jgi:hypothetical protein
VLVRRCTPLRSTAAAMLPLPCHFRKVAALTLPAFAVQGSQGQHRPRCTAARAAKQGPGKVHCKPICVHASAHYNSTTMPVTSPGSVVLVLQQGDVVSGPFHSLPQP